MDSKKRVLVFWILMGILSGLIAVALILDMVIYLGNMDLAYIVISLELTSMVLFGTALYVRWPSTFTIMMVLTLVFVILGVFIVEPNIQPHFTKEIVVVGAIGAITLLIIAWVGIWYTSGAHQGIPRSVRYTKMDLNGTEDTQGIPSGAPVTKEPDLFNCEVVEVKIIEV